MTNENLTKITCPRCDGSGHYSFNLIHGTVCFKCSGAGFIMGDVSAIARNKKAKEARLHVERERQAMMSAAYREVVAQMDAIYHIGNTDTALGLQTLDYMVIKETGRSIAQHRDALIAGQA
jgi:Ni,Fe-hydrogenase I small subunit